ncbi:EcsC family protein [Acidisphaera sp. S103]|uniref:EcsC family protein n=1 Tax=Acidisphaera sp. S103 TaxID=1747223 RepID=UPI00131D4558|nr:EcsC family protein [Acidisphaera sp. S103]
MSNQTIDEDGNEVEEKENVITKIVDWMVEKSLPEVDKYVGSLRSLNPEISNDALARKIVSRKSMKNGLVGAATGVGGLITLPVTVPADLVASWKIQIFMAIAIAHVYGHDLKAANIKTDIFLILAGDSAKEGLKRLGVEMTKGITKKAIDKYITREIMVKIWKIIPQKIITKAGEKSLTSFMKMVPLVGAPIGFTFDWLSARATGKVAIHYYSGGD